MTILQYKMMKLFAKESYLPDGALTFDQRIFGSICAVNKSHPEPWIEYSVRRGFHIAQAGRNELTRVDSLPAYRKFNNGKFAKAVPNQSNIHYMKAQAKAAA